jgi:hypothetical protein
MAKNKLTKVHMHMESVNFNNCIYAYKDKREGEVGRGSEVEFLHFGGKMIIVFSYISMEKAGKVWRENEESVYLRI